RLAADTAARMYSNAYQSSLDNYTSALLGAPNIMSSFNMPANTALAAGGQQQALDQARLGEDFARFNYERDAPWQRMQEYMRLLLGVPGGQTTNATAPQTNPLLTGLG